MLTQMIIDVSSSIRYTRGCLYQLEIMIYSRMTEYEPCMSLPIQRFPSPFPLVYLKYRIDQGCLKTTRGPHTALHAISDSEAYYNSIFFLCNKNTVGSLC